MSIPIENQASGWNSLKELSEKWPDSYIEFHLISHDPATSVATFEIEFVDYERIKAWGVKRTPLCAVLFAPIYRDRVRLTAVPEVTCLGGNHKTMHISDVRMTTDLLKLSGDGQSVEFQLLPSSEVSLTRTRLKKWYRGRALLSLQMWGKEATF